MPDQVQSISYPSPQIGKLLYSLPPATLTTRTDYESTNTYVPKLKTEFFLETCFSSMGKSHEQNGYVCMVLKRRTDSDR